MKLKVLETGLEAYSTFSFPVLDRQLQALTYDSFALILLSYNDNSTMCDCNDVNNAEYVQWLCKNLYQDAFDTMSLKLTRTVTSPGQ